MEKILTLLVGLLIALGGWSLSRTFELSTNQAVLKNKVERLGERIHMENGVEEVWKIEMVKGLIVVWVKEVSLMREIW